MNDAHKLIVFSLNEQCYGLPLPVVTQILRAVEVTPLPKTTDLILGVVNVHGDVMPVMNIRELLGLNKKSIGIVDRFIVTNIFSKNLIIVVDSVLNIIHYFENEISPVDCFFPKNSEHIKGILKKDNQLIFILDIEKLLSQGDCQEIEKLTVDRNKII